MKCCLGCGGEIVGKAPQAKYCSKLCKERCRPTAGMDAPRYRLRKERRELLDKIKLESGCVNCGYNEHPAALTFDHIDPTTKCFTPSHAVSRSMEKLEEELAKCRILCANCHNVFTQTGELPNGKSKT